MLILSKPDKQGSGNADLYLKAPLFFSHPVKTQPSLLYSMRTRARHLRTQKPSLHFLSSLLPPGFTLRHSTQTGQFPLLVGKTEVPRAPHAPTAREGAASPGSQHCPPSGSCSGRLGVRELQLMLRAAREYGCAPVPGASTGCARSEETKPCLVPEESAVSSSPVSAGTHPRAGQSGRSCIAPPAPLPEVPVPVSEVPVPVPVSESVSEVPEMPEVPEVPPQSPRRRGERSCPRNGAPRPAPPAGSPAYWLRWSDLHGGAPPPQCPWEDARFASLAGAGKLRPVGAGKRGRGELAPLFAIVPGDLP